MEKDKDFHSSESTHRVIFTFHFFFLGKREEEEGREGGEKKEQTKMIVLFCFCLHLCVCSF